jgi:hypothetical protein|tara:strand:+ start:1838 stop:2017 length:180 start_codon:yes stop_codon:yes gene_type:complete
MNRKLKISGAEVPEFDVAIRLKVVTRCPGKWKLTDMETGEEYIGQVPTENDTHHWKKIE